jgi:hypothetical protein
MSVSLRSGAGSGNLKANLRSSSGASSSTIFSISLRRACTCGAEVEGSNRGDVRREKIKKKDAKIQQNDTKMKEMRIHARERGAMGRSRNVLHDEKRERCKSTRIANIAHTKSKEKS